MKTMDGFFGKPVHFYGALSSTPWSTLIHSMEHSHPLHGAFSSIFVKMENPSILLTPDFLKHYLFGAHRTFNSAIKGLLNVNINFK